MGGSLAIRRYDGPACDLADRSCTWGASGGVDALLAVGVPSDEGIVLGAFQRRAEVHETSGLPIFRRGSGGGVARVGPGTVWLQLSLARADALVACTPDKLLNRYVRPLLKALTRVASVPVSYFGRDWISAAQRPVALVSFGHDARTNQSLFEAIVAVTTPFAGVDRPTFLGKSPATLEAVADRSLDPARVAGAVVDAYAAIATAVMDSGQVGRSSETAGRIEDEPPWSATREEAIGIVGAGRDESGKLRVGGELMASRDAMTRLEELVAALPASATADDVGRVVDAALTTHGAVTFGVRSLASIRDVIVEASRAS